LRVARGTRLEEGKAAERLQQVAELGEEGEKRPGRQADKERK
jgi:hypothetical protein